MADITELTALTGLPNGQVIHVRHPDRGGIFAFTTGGAGNQDEGITFDDDKAGGVFTRQEVASGYNPKWWKKPGDPDDTTAFTRCIAAVEHENNNPIQPYLGKSGSSAFKHNTAYVDITPGVYHITSPLTLTNASIIGRSKSSCVIFHDVSSEVDLFCSPEYLITGVTPGNAGSRGFEIAGDHSSLFVDGFLFKVVGSNGNDGKYTVSASRFEARNDVLRIAVAEAVPHAATGGSIRVLNTGYAIDIHNLTLVGSGDLREDLDGTASVKRPLTSKCAINLHQAIWACSISNVIISQFKVGICANDCWSFRIEDSVIFNCPRCMEWYSAIGVDCANTRFEACYAQGVRESEHGVYLRRGSYRPQSISFSGCCFQGAGKAGVYVEDATNIVFNSCFFERNDLEDGGNGYCDVRSNVGATSAATFIGCVWTSASALENKAGDCLNSVCLNLVKVRNTNLIGCEMRDGKKRFWKSIVADSECSVVSLLGSIDATTNGTDLDRRVHGQVL